MKEIQENNSELKKLTDIESIDAFEIIDLEEKLDFNTVWVEVNIGCHVD